MHKYGSYEHSLYFTELNEIEVTRRFYGVARFLNGITCLVI